MVTRQDSTRDGSGLKQELRRWQIFFIVLTAVIGGGVFSSNGEALEIAGPAGFLTAIVIFGLISIAVLDGVSEFVQLFPVQNALPEYAKAFVDRDLGWIVGLAYWYTFSATFSVQNLAAANLSRYWDLSQLWQTLGFYILAPILVLAINMFGVSIFGWIESVSGVLKLCLAVGTAITLYAIAGIAKVGNLGPINDGFQDNDNYVTNHPKAVCYAIPLVAFSYLGQEIFVVTAYEAKRAKDLRRPSQILPYVVFSIYLLIAIGEALNVKWQDPHLPRIYGGLDPVPRDPPINPRSSSMVVVAVFQAGYRNLAGFLNGCLIFSVLSASNTSLYVASRTLYGLACRIPDTNPVGRKLQWLKIVPFRNGVPAWCLVISAISFCWLPFLQLKKGYPVQDLQTILSVSASISCVLVWMVLCIAFIRYCSWLSKCKNDVPREIPWCHRNSKTHRAYTFLGFAQPFMAWLGLIGCTVVLAFASATWWDTPPSFAKVAVAYAAPIILLPTWLIIKFASWYRGHGWGFVKIDSNVANLSTVVSELAYGQRAAKVADRGVGSERHEGTIEEGKGFNLEEYVRGSHDYHQDHPPPLDDGYGPNAPEVSPVQEYPPLREFPDPAYFPTHHQPSRSTFMSGAAEAQGHSQTELLGPVSYMPPHPHMPPANDRYPG